METTRNSQAGNEFISYLKRIVTVAIGVTVMMLGSSWVKMLLMDHHGPRWMRLGALALLWLVFGLYVWICRRVWRPDELQELISRRSLALAFYGMMFGILVIEQLQAAGLVPVFAWTSQRLIFAMAGFLAAGTLWAKFRYL